jgi:transketolase
VAASKRALGWDPAKSFYVPDEVRAHMKESVDRARGERAEWDRRRAAWEKENAEAARELARWMAGELPEGWDSDLPRFAAGEKIATRVAGGKAQAAIAKRVENLLGGDADLGGSTKTIIPGGSFDGQTGAGRNIHFGVREHAMGSICNGLDYHGGIRPYAATFFCFSDYMRPAVRLASLNKQPVIYVWTHDSIGLGEDGPTHQPVEHLMALRAMPNLWVVRPGDACETVAAWRLAVARTKGPTALVLSRQNLPVLDPARAAELERGAYILAGDERPDVILIGTGSEVSVAMEARGQLAAAGVACRVVSMPCWEAFHEQPASYRDRVLPPDVRARVSVEAGVTFGWREWIGNDGEAVGVDRFGASAPAEVLFEKLGITAAHVVAAARRTLERTGSRR